MESLARGTGKAGYVWVRQIEAGGVLRPGKGRRGVRMTGTAIGGVVGTACFGRE